MTAADDYLDKIANLDDTTRDQLEAGRLIGVTHVHPDGSATVQSWHVTVDVADLIVDILGPPDATMLIPTGTAADLVALEQGLPSLTPE